jgi:xylan 1,4-beta-xylosidase
VGAFLKHTSELHVAVDFVSTHGYADDTVENLFGTNEDIAMDDRMGRAVAKIRTEIKSSANPDLPLLWTEWNVQGMNESRDTIFVGPALANTIRECDGLVDMLSFWTFSDVFEEGGPLPKPFIGEFGLRAKGGINKPSYYSFGLLHQLGSLRIANESKNVIATKTADGDIALVAWNLVDPDQHGITRAMELTFRDVPSNAKVFLQSVDSDHGNVLKQYAAIGKPIYPTPDQVAQLNRETSLPAPKQSTLRNGVLELELTPNALVLVKIEVRPQK